MFGKKTVGSGGTTRGGISRRNFPRKGTATLALIGLVGVQYVAGQESRPTADIPINLFVQLMNCVGLETERFADSTGQLDLCA
jgi:hypothetical protein